MKKKAKVTTITIITCVLALTQVIPSSAKMMIATQNYNSSLGSFTDKAITNNSWETYRSLDINDKIDNGINPVADVKCGFKDGLTKNYDTCRVRSSKGITYEGMVTNGESWSFSNQGDQGYYTYKAEIVHKNSNVQYRINLWIN